MLSTFTFQPGFDKLHEYCVHYALPPPPIRREVNPHKWSKYCHVMIIIYCITYVLIYIECYTYGLRRRRSPSRSELIKGVNYCSGKQAGSTSQELWAPPCTLVPSLEQCAVRAACALFLVGRDHVYAQNHNMARLHMMSDVRNISFRKLRASLWVEKKLQDTKSRRQACETYGKQACNAGLAGM